MTSRAVSRHAASGWRWLRSRSPLAVLAIGFAAFVIYAFPGYMSTDSVNQLIEARTRQFSDGHPPIMAAQWAVLDAVVSGPFLMLVVQGAMFLAGLDRLLRRDLAPRRAAASAVALLMFPPVMTTMAVIWKDSQMAGYLIAGTACLCSPRRWTRVIGVALIACACGFRFNAAVAALPLVGLLFEWRPGVRGWQRYAVAALVFLVAVSASLGVNRLLTVIRSPVPPLIGLAVTDIAGVLRFTSDRGDEPLRELMRGTPLRITSEIQATARARYSPRNSYWLSHGDQAMFGAPGSAAESEAMIEVWKQLALGDPPAYLEHRAAVFGEVLGLSDDPLWSPVYNLFLEEAGQSERLQHRATRSYVQRVAARRLGWLAEHTVLFRAYLYAALALALLALGGSNRLTLALLLSGILYELSFFAAASTPDFRYSHWMIACTCIAAVQVFVRRWRAGVAGRSSPTQP